MVHIYVGIKYASQIKLIKPMIVCHVRSMGRALAFRADGPGSIPGPA